MGNEGPYRADESERRIYSSPDIFDALKIVSARVSGPLRLIDYQEHRDEHHPSAWTIVSRVGWSTACDRAGVESPRSRSDKEFTETDCVQAVSTALVERGTLISSSEYEQWSRGREDVPSLRTVKKRTGGWSTALEVAQELTEID